MHKVWIVVLLNLVLVMVGAINFKILSNQKARIDEAEYKSRSLLTWILFAISALMLQLLLLAVLVGGDE